MLFKYKKKGDGVQIKPKFLVQDNKSNHKKGNYSHTEN